MNKKGIILLSGGLDSATVAAIAVKEGFRLSAITFFYSQRHEVEISFAEKLVKYFNMENHVKISIPSEIFKTALNADSGIEVPKSREIIENVIPVTYVPARNIIFLSYALAYAESTDAEDIFIGANAVDYSGYPDCRPEFFQAFKRMADIGTKAGVEGRGFTIHTPLLHLKKHEIIKTGIELGVDYSLTHSCYDPDSRGLSCGECDSCIIRKNGFLEAGFPDPTKYREK
jgi:7-cyano-7-deazaguanine synthase